MNFRQSLPLIALLFLTAMSAHALKTPRFVSLKFNEVNMRTGPGERYPIKWVYKRQFLPVEIVDEYEYWRQIRDMDGELGWVHKNQLSGLRTVVMMKEIQALRRFPESDAPTLFSAEPGVVARIIRCNSDFCYVSIKDRKGWVAKRGVFGVYDDEMFED